MFEKIVSPEVAQEIISAFDSEPKMIKICKYFIQAALFLQREAVLDELRCEELCESAQSILDDSEEKSEQFEDLQFICMTLFPQEEWIDNM